LVVVKAQLRILSPALDAWCSRASKEDQTTAIVRIGAAVDPHIAVTRLGSLGLEVTSAGPSSIIGEATATVLHDIAGQRWVLAIEEPRQLRTN
jgi:hypothetical protein